MGNITIDAPLVNGDLMPYIDAEHSCADAAHLITGDDLSPPARHVAITITTTLGKTVRVVIPNDAQGQATVTIDGERV